MKYVVFFLGFLLTLALFAQRTECFTAGIGNVGVNGKRQVKVSRKHLFALYMKQKLKPNITMSRWICKRSVNSINFFLEPLRFLLEILLNEKLKNSFLHIT